MRKSKKWILFFFCLTALAVGIFFVCFDRPYNMHYTVEASTTQPNVLEISLDISNSILSKGKRLSLYTGDKMIALKSCVDKSGDRLPAQHLDTSIDFYLGRGGKVTLSYEVKVGSLGKHGLRGSTSENYCIFDGGEAFLLPMEFYETNYPENKAVIGQLSITMKKRSGWIEVTPYTNIQNVTWADAYDLNNNSFCMGRFILHHNNALKIYTLAQNNEEVSRSVQDGIFALYHYYADLFSVSQKNYDVILLPPSDGTDSSIIGGAGTGSVCATFHTNSKRDWELLSHRMFHAYFDSIVRRQTFHSAPYLWFYEGIATYYENRSMGFLPKDVQVSVNLKPEQEFTSLFNKYLYVRLKDPTLFSFAPMDEKNITESQAGGAKIEFLHYVQAPLVVRLMEDISFQQSKQSDSLLKYLLINKDHPDQCTYAQILKNLLGKRAEEIYHSYFLSNSILPLWSLHDDTYSQKQTLTDLNDIENQLASWMTGLPGKYPTEELNMKTIQKIENRSEFQSVLFSDGQTEQSVQNFSPVIDSLLKEYALRANICNVSFNDPELRSKLLLDAKNKAKWTAWIE